jgi:hypothetical protein
MLRERREAERVGGVGKEGRGRTVCLLVHAGPDTGDAVSEAGLGGSQARVRGREVFDFLG